MQQNNVPDTPEQENYGMPANWVPIDSQPIRPNQFTGGPPQAPQMDQYFSGSIPSNLQLQPDLFGTQYGNGIVPNVRLMPVAPAGVPTSVSAAQSVTTQVNDNTLILQMPAQFSVQNGSTTVVKWNVVPAGLTLMGPQLNAGIPSFRSILNTDLVNAIFGPLGGSHAPGAVPDPGPTGPNTLFLRNNGTWSAVVGNLEVNSILIPGIPNFNNTVPSPLVSGYAPVIFEADASLPATNISASLAPFTGSGSSHAPGAVPDPGSTPGSSKFLNENGTFQVPSGASGANQSVQVDETIFSDDYWCAVEVTGSPVWMLPFTVM